MPTEPMGVQREGGWEFGSSGERSGRSLEVADRLGTPRHALSRAAVSARSDRVARSRYSLAQRW